MKKYAQIVDERTKKCNVGLGTNTEFYKEIGMVEMDVEQAYNGDWYVEGYAPVQPAPTIEEQKQKRADAYQLEVDPITSHISRLRDEENPDEDKIAELIEERAEKVAEIQEKYPYPVGK